MPVWRWNYLSSMLTCLSISNGNAVIDVCASCRMLLRQWLQFIYMLAMTGANSRTNGLGDSLLWHLCVSVAQRSSMEK